MKEFIANYGYIIAYLLGVLIVAVVQKDWQKLKDMAHNAILNAKRAAKDGILTTGQEQEDFAVLHFYPLLPVRLRVFVSEDLFRKIVQWLYQKAVDLLDDGDINGSITFDEEGEGK